MDVQFPNNRIAKRTILVFAMLLLTGAAGGDTSHTLSLENEGAVPGSAIGRNVPRAPDKEECGHEDEQRNDSLRRRHKFSGKIEGRVLDAVTGRGVPGVFVQLERDRDGRRCISEPTNASGHYFFKVALSDADGESFHAQTLALDYADALGSGTLFLGRPLKIDFRAALRPTATVRGTVTDADTELPVVGATVAVACVPACNGTRHEPAITGADGRYELRGVPFSPTGAIESATPITVTVPENNNRCYSASQSLEVDDFDVIGNIRLKPSSPCVQPRLLLPPSCGTPPPTDDKFGRLVTWCLGPANETDVATNPNNGMHIVVVAKDYSLGKDIGNTCKNAPKVDNVWRVWTGVYTSFDGGVTWSNDLLPGFPGDTRPTGVPNQQCMSDPVIAFTPNGELYLAALAWGASHRTGLLVEHNLILARSPDSGLTWDIRNIYPGFTDTEYADKPWLAIDPEYATNRTLYVGWHLFSARLQTFIGGKLTTVIDRNPAAPLLSHEAIPGIRYAPAPVVLRDHSVVVAGRGSWCDGEPGSVSCVVVSRKKATGHWDDDAANLGSFGMSKDLLPTIAVDRSRGRTDGNVAVAWSDGGELRVSYSSDIQRGGRTWNPVNPPGPSIDAVKPTGLLPRVAISPMGIVGVLYYDYNNTTKKLSAHYLSGGRSGEPVWRTPVPLSGAFSPGSPPNPTTFNQRGEVFIGDYVGLTFGGFGNPIRTWADGRHDRSDIFFKSEPPRL
jgi:hypothetical protein